jgi:tetratricopeptide (TPR) repeat protein
VASLASFALTALFLVTTAGGCKDDTQTLRSIQASRQLRQQSEAKVDHLGEAFSLVSNLIELQPESAARQIIYHLNSWKLSQPAAAQLDVPTDLLKSISQIVPIEASTTTVTRQTFDEADVELLKLRYLYRQVAEFARSGAITDPLFDTWIKENRGTLGEENADQLAVAVRLFDWMVRNIALQPLDLNQPVPNVTLPLGMKFSGAGYRQTPLQTLFRGTGDALQRCGTFMGLCRQADLPACLLATAPSADSSDEPRPWAVGVLIGQEVYLFDCALGIPIVGPGQAGIATLAQARRDATVLRRMNVPGWFDYPLQKDDIQQCVALLMMSPESLSGRARQLQEALTGDLRLGVYDDPQATVDAFVANAGIATAKIWETPILAQSYQVAVNRFAEQDPMVMFLTTAPWAILDAEFDQAKRLALGRWRHLQGDLDGNDVEGIEGAKKLYLSQRQPEFEIADLRIDVELQKNYGIRRDLGVPADVYDRQIQQVQAFMRQGKVTATYWLGLIQYDTNRFDLAKNWFQQRVLEDGLESDWENAARYNLARTFESLGEIDKATELYKFEGLPQEHGNRIRARLINRETESAETPASP